MIADDIGVFLVVGEHFIEVAFAVCRIEPAFGFERVSRPIECRRFSEERSAAAVEEASDDLVFWIVVFRLWIFVHVEACVAPDAGHEGVVVGIGQALEVEDRHAFAVVEPVEAYGEFLVEHSVSSQFDLNSLLDMDAETREQILAVLQEANHKAKSPKKEEDLY